MNGFRLNHWAGVSTRHSTWVVVKIMVLFWVLLEYGT